MSASVSELNFPMKSNRTPKVIVFEDPGAKNSAKKGSKVNLKRKRSSTQEGEDELEFLDIAREVKEFGVTGFSKKIQKKDKQKYAEYLGAHKPKNQKVPYPMLIERAKKRKEKEEKEKEMEVAMGIFKKRKKEDKEKISQKLNLGRWVDKSNVIGSKQRDTNINVSKREIEKLKHTKKK